MIDTQIERMMDTNTQTPIRSLASLTDQEAHTLFTLAFRYSPNVSEFSWSVETLPDRPYFVIFRHKDIGLHIDPTGLFYAFKARMTIDHTMAFNARKVLIYLALLGIHFDEA